MNKIIEKCKNKIETQKKFKTWDEITDHFGTLYLPRISTLHHRVYPIVSFVNIPNALCRLCNWSVCSLKETFHALKIYRVFNLNDILCWIAIVTCDSKCIMMWQTWNHIGHCLFEMNVLLISLTYGHFIVM